MVFCGMLHSLNKIEESNSEESNTINFSTHNYIGWAPTATASTTGNYWGGSNIGIVENDISLSGNIYYHDTVLAGTHRTTAFPGDKYTHESSIFYLYPSTPIHNWWSYFNAPLIYTKIESVDINATYKATFKNYVSGITEYPKSGYIVSSDSSNGLWMIRGEWKDVDITDAVSYLTVELDTI